MTAKSRLLLISTLLASLGANIFLFFVNNSNTMVIGKLSEDLTTVKKSLKQEQDIYELRHSLDIDARAFIKAMVKADRDTMKKYVANNITVTTDKLFIYITDANPREHDYIYSWLKGIGDLRQAQYSLDEKGRFTTGYQTYMKDGQNLIIVITFSKVNGAWKIEDLGNDT